ncbi:hypothetical protein FNV43_RR16560 [Rhamnella rubrinervis]|uniref:Uncharacterized protein n=1 Tax=Rhamnella rubrinervis TaxID=2594499 RepID=A0A8K0GZ19_9ROSA|nr:hypothetical protein FNV43_RR16560 [Rhamnella rubrinervis]
MESANVNVQHVNKKSSDELLRKFAEDEAPPKKELRLSKRRKRSRSATARGQCDSPSNNGSSSTSNGSSTSLVERRSLLPSATRKSALLRQLGMHGGSHLRLRARDIQNKSVFGTIKKTWSRTIEGASKVFMEKHYNRHKRLINDMV